MPGLGRLPLRLPVLIFHAVPDEHLFRREPARWFVTFAEISMPGLYLEPIGLLYGPVAREAVTLGSALPLAGGSIAFGAVRLWEGEPGNIKHAVVRTNTIQAIDDPRVK